MLPRHPETFPGLRVITAGSGFKDLKQGGLDIDARRDFEFGGKKWAFHANPLAPDYSFHTRIGEYDEKRVADTDIWLDWHDFSSSNTARLLTFIGKFEDVPFEVKQERIERLARTIQAYDSLMVPPEISSQSELENTVNDGHLPRPAFVQLIWYGNNDHMGLEHLARGLGLEEDVEFSLAWVELLDLARSGRLVEEWNRLARQEGDVMFAPEPEDPDAPEVFGKEQFCEAVTGHSPSELRQMVHDDYVVPIDQIIAVGRDEPRSSSDGIIDNWLTFMNLPIRAPLLPLERHDLYGSVLRFWRSREYTDRFDRGNFDNYWLPVLNSIQAAYDVNDDNHLRENVKNLVEKILKF